MKKGFVSTMRKGFYMTFENGLTVSVQWGAGNYCDNHSPEDNDFRCSKDAKSSDAEVTVIYKGEPLDPCKFTNDPEVSGDGMVSGFLTPEQVAEILYIASTMERETFLPWYEEARMSNPFNDVTTEG